MDICRAIRWQANDDQHRLPVVMVAEQEDQDSGTAAGVTDWLIKPFTGAYARTKIRVWLLRTASQWVRRGVPMDEEWRAASARAMRILDTEADDGFDRSTRLYAKSQKGAERRRSSERASSSDKSDLLWMYGREIASIETQAFRSKVGEIIAQATRTPSGQRRMRPPRGSNQPA
jgi:DNA-binding response OmpR family regulator